MDHQWPVESKSSFCRLTAWSYGTPIWRRAGSIRIAGREEDRQLMCRQGLGVGSSLRRRWPPAKTSRRQTLVAEPETLAIINQDFDRCAASITEDKDRAGERILPERIVAEPN
jgi:hypothetical protein